MQLLAILCLIFCTCFCASVYASSDRGHTIQLVAIWAVVAFCGACAFQAIFWFEIVVNHWRTVFLLLKNAALVASAVGAAISLATLISERSDKDSRCVDNRLDDRKKKTENKSTVSTIGPYTVLRELGRGGFGTVFQAAAPDGTLVAIKMIGGVQMRQAPRNTVADASRMGLVKEARLESMLQHPNIVNVYDIGQHRGSLYIVMEYIEGETLNRYVRSHTVSLLRIIQIVSELCDALDHAHVRGILHRDIKPANIVVLPDGRVKILDFGLAALKSDATNKIRVGTLLYMSPERLRGDTLDAGTDIWSVGVTLYELIMGRLPFIAPTPESLLRRIASSPAPLIPSETPESVKLNSILERALSKAPRNRYATARDLASDLREVQIALQPASASNAAGDEVLRANRALTVNSERLPTKEGDNRRYSQEDLGFRRRLAGRAVLREKVLRPLTKAVKPANQIGGLITTVVIVVLSILVRTRGSFVSINQLFLVLVVLLILVAGALGVLGIISKRRSQRCADCHATMQLTKKLIRFVTSNEAIQFGRSDCRAAIREGMWEDSVKLLSIHGSDKRELYTCIRYTLEFLECRSCPRQLARLNIEDLIDGKHWQLREVIEGFKTVPHDGRRADASRGKQQYSPRA